MIQLTELHFSLSLCVMFFIGALLTMITAIIICRIRTNEKEKEISELVRKIAGGEQERRGQADSLRLALLDNSNLKHRIFKLLKNYSQMSKTPFGKALRGVIDE